MQCSAENSRAHSDERLMKRGVRHVMGKAAPSIFEGRIGAATCKNEMVLMFENQVKPCESRLTQNKDMF